MGVDVTIEGATKSPTKAGGVLAKMKWGAALALVSAIYYISPVLSTVRQNDRNSGGKPRTTALLARLRGWIKGIGEKRGAIQKANEHSSETANAASEASSQIDIPVYGRQKAEADISNDASCIDNSHTHGQRAMQLLYYRDMRILSVKVPISRRYLCALQLVETSYCVIQSALPTVKPLRESIASVTCYRSSKMSDTLDTLVERSRFALDIVHALEGRIGEKAHWTDACARRIRLDHRRQRITNWEVRNNIA